jgi:hypothetical protein
MIDLLKQLGMLIKMQIATNAGYHTATGVIPVPQHPLPQMQATTLPPVSFL